MRHRLMLHLSSALTLLALTPFTHAAVQDRIAAISSGSRVALPHSVPAKARAAADLGPVSAGLKLDSVTFRFNMTPAQQAALTQLLIAQQNPSSPLYHQWLTPEQFGAQFGLSSGDLAKVSTWLTTQGLTVTATSRSHTFVTVSGSASQVEQALHTSIHNLNWNGEQHFANISDPALPAQIAGVVSGISGLNDFKLKPRARVSVVREPVHTQFTSSISGNHYMAPGDFYTIYDVNPLLTSSINGTGIKIAVMGQTDINLADVTAFRTASGLPTNLPTIVLAAGSTDPGTLTSDVSEADLDVEWSGAVAPSASIIFVNSTDVLGLSLQYAVDQNLAPILSISYGDCESNFGISNLNSFNLLLQQANAQGQTLVGPGGDSGATDCDYQASTATQGLAVDYPASSPFATGAGGTMFNEGNATGATSYWSGTDGKYSGSATGYIPETVWNETLANIATAGGTLGAGGGGLSAFFTKPYWQVGPGVPNDSARDVPDIALNSAASHDGYLFCTQGSCVTGFRASDGQSLSVVGGTSVAAPSFAGILALVEQQIQSRIGNANPVLYALANSTYSANVFHDITTGNNDSPCTAGTTSCPTGGSIGYSATPGYDLTTGWGSIDAYNLATKWKLVTPETNTGLAGTQISSTTISTSSPICGVPSATLALTITVTPAKAGTSATPTGTVQLMVDGTASGAPILLANGSATYTFKTAGLTSGAHVISAIYSGDNSFAGSKNTLSTDVVSATQPDFAFTPCTANVAVASGSTSSGTTLTLASVNGFSGSVNMTATSNDATLAAAYSFSVTPVVITAGNSTTTVFTLQAYQVSAKTGHGLVKIAPVQTSINSAPWYLAGSGATLACMVLLTVPRRRRWGALFAVLCTVGMLGAAGCSGNTLQNTTTTTTTTTTDAAPGTYNLMLSATSGSIVHSVNLAVTIQ